MASKTPFEMKSKNQFGWVIMSPQSETRSCSHVSIYKMVGTTEDYSRAPTYFPLQCAILSASASLRQAVLARVGSNKLPTIPYLTPKLDLILNMAVTRGTAVFFRARVMYRNPKIYLLLSLVA